jgi:predicted ester cyclase
MGTIQGSDAMTDLYETLFAAPPDLHATALDVVADEDTVWCRLIVERTNEGSLFGFPATGRTISFDEIDMFRVANGKIVEEWSSPDFTNVLYQVGAYTPPWIPDPLSTDLREASAESSAAASGEPDAGDGRTRRR